MGRAKTATPTSEGQVVITLKAYLHELEGAQLRKPESDRLPVPSLVELADCINIHKVTMINLANGNIKLLNLSTAKAIIDEMRSRGFEMQISDLIDYQPGSQREKRPEPMGEPRS